MEPVNQNKGTSFRIPADIYSSIEAIAERYFPGMSANALAIRMLREMIELINSPKDKRPTAMLIAQIDATPYRAEVQDYQLNERPSAETKKESVARKATKKVT